MGALSTKLDELMAEVDLFHNEVNGEVDAFLATLKSIAPDLLARLEGVGVEVKAAKDEIVAKLAELDGEIDAFTK